MPIKLSLVIPCYNEAANISLILEKFAAVISRKDIEIIMVNNGSKDNSEKILTELLPKYPFARTVRVEVNQGYGYGILQGLAAARGEYLGWTHADMQTDPADCLKALDIIEQQGNPQNIYIKGNRKGRSWVDNFFTVGMACLETILLKVPLWDINAQPNIFHRSFYQSWENPPNDFSLDLFVFYNAVRQKLKIVRFKVLFPPRLHGESKWNTGAAAKLKFIRRTLDYSWRLTRNLHRKSKFRP